MKILFINPSLRPKSETLFLPVGLAYVMTYAQKNGYKFELLDIDVARYSDQYVDDFLIKNKYDVICMGSIVTHYKWIKWCINIIKENKEKFYLLI